MSGFPVGGGRMQTSAAERGGLRDGGEESGRLRAALADLRGLLVQGESLEAYAVQRRMFALGHRRLIVGATTGRLILLQRGLIGGVVPPRSEEHTSELQSQSKIVFRLLL